MSMEKGRPATSESRVWLLAKDLSLGVKNLFLPAFCYHCDGRILTEDNLYFCPDCWQTIELVSDPKCPRCGRPHTRRVGFEAIGNFVCSECVSQKLWVRHTHAAGIHSGVMRDAIHLLKYKRKRLVARPLATLLLEALRDSADLISYDAVVPVPLHGNRRRERGYNQSGLIAEHLCREISRLLLLPALRRVKDTPSFSMLGSQERRNEIRNAFQLAPGTDVRGKKIALLDDVVTTGATTNECARVLCNAGADVVDVISVAAARRLH